MDTPESTYERMVSDHNMRWEENEAALRLERVSTTSARAAENEAIVKSVFMAIRRVESRAKELLSSVGISPQEEGRGMMAAIGEVWRASGMPNAPAIEECGHVLGSQWIDSQGTCGDDFGMCVLNMFHEDEHQKYVRKDTTEPHE